MTAVFVGGRFNGLEIDAEAVVLISNGKRSADWSKARASGACVPRAELDNRPLVDGYLSPMLDGGVIRYETQDVYDMLSM